VLSPADAHWDHEEEGDHEVADHRRDRDEQPDHDEQRISAEARSQPMGEEADLLRLLRRAGRAGRDDVAEIAVPFITDRVQELLFRVLGGRDGQVEDEQVMAMETPSLNASSRAVRLRPGRSGVAGTRLHCSSAHAPDIGMLGEVGLPAVKRAVGPARLGPPRSAASSGRVRRGRVPRREATPGYSRYATAWGLRTRQARDPASPR
jgi:hypothetical protein